MSAITRELVFRKKALCIMGQTLQQIPFSIPIEYQVHCECADIFRKRFGVLINAHIARKLLLKI